MELMIYKMIRKSGQTSVKAPHIDSLRDIITELTAEHQDQLIQEAEMLQEDQDDEDINEEDEVGDMEYALDATDEGRNALFALLIAAAAIKW